MQDKTIVITGASDGIGEATAYELSNMGADVIVVGRSPEKTKQVADKINADYYLADFAKLNEVRMLAQQLVESYPKIDVLINNAGGIFSQRELTIDGYEMCLQVNHLAPFLLTNLLMDTLISSNAKIINTSSIANKRYGNIDINDLNLESGYSPNRAYGNAKLANILFTKELHRRYNTKGITSAAVHPGIVATNFANDSSSYLRFIYKSFVAKLFLDSPEQGAEPLIWLASTEPGKNWQSGHYYEKHKDGAEHTQASDPRLAERLWEMSSEYTKIRGTKP